MKKIFAFIKKIFSGSENQNAAHTTHLYIDDERDPKTDKNWIVKRTSKESIDFMTGNGCPEYISFDHDLGGEDTSMAVVKWMVEKDLDTQGQFIPENFEFNVHSANPVGKGNIESYLNSYLKSRVAL